MVTYTYNGEGSLYSVTAAKDGAETRYIYGYDSLGRLISSEWKDNGASVLRTRQGYDDTNRLVTQSWQLGGDVYTEGFTYNSTQDGSLNTHTTATGQTLTMGYDELRRLSTVTGGIYGKTFTYRDISNTKTTTQVSSVVYDLPTDLTYGYTYDTLGNIATYTDANGTVTYTYDAQGQLLSAVGDESYTYTYDTVGNILTANGHTYTYGDSVWKDLLTAYDGQSITYDASGNPTSYYNGTRWTFGWTNGRRLATATDGTTNLSYTYDTDGLRTSKTVDGVKHSYLYAGGKLLRETYGDYTLDFFYDSNGTPYALKHNGTIYYYITNLQGDVMHLVNADGAVVASYEYDPYGNITSSSGDLAAVNPLRYRGYYYDTETGLYYVSSRYYDPEIGRFINADALVSTGQGLLGNNMFAYCVNNPVNMADPTGHCSYFLFFKMDCFSATCPDSQCYNPDAPNVVVIYDGRFSGYFGYFHDHGFEQQGSELSRRLVATSAVTSYSYTTVDEFIDIWNGLDGSYDAIYIVAHGYEGELRFKGQHSIAAQNGDYSFSDLDRVSVDSIYLYACNGATIYGENGSIAMHLSNITGASVRAVKDGKLNFTWYCCFPIPARGGYWVTVS